MACPRAIYLRAWSRCQWAQPSHSLGETILWSVYLAKWIGSGQASAANHPRQPRLSSHGRRHGPAVKPPSLPWQHNIHQIENCMSMNINNRIEVPAIQIKVKVYPLTVCTFFLHWNLAEPLLTGSQYWWSNLLQVPTRVMECPIRIVPPSIFIQASALHPCHNLDPVYG